MTVDLFVRQDSLFSALTRQRVFNNHPLLSGANWVVFQLGGESEAWQRAVPLAASAACLAMLAWWAHRRFGALASAVATAIFALNPLTVELGSQARGYSMAALSAAGATILLHEWTRGGQWRPWAYSACVALGLLAHLYVAIVFISHWAAVAWCHRSRLRSWEFAALRGACLAGVVYLPTLGQMLDQSSRGGGKFWPRFPAETATTLAGSPIAGGALCALVIYALLRSKRLDLIVMASAAGLLVLVIWVGVRPQHLYPRFLVWAVPLGALAIGSLVSRTSRAAILVLPIAIAWAPGAVAGPDDQWLHNVAERYDGINSTGEVVCTYGAFAEALLVYTSTPVRPAEGRNDCSIVLSDHRYVHELPDAFAVLGPVRDSPNICLAVRSAQASIRRHVQPDFEGSDCSRGETQD